MADCAARAASKYSRASNCSPLLRTSVRYYIALQVETRKSPQRGRHGLACLIVSAPVGHRALVRRRVDEVGEAVNQLGSLMLIGFVKNCQRYQPAWFLVRVVAQPARHVAPLVVSRHLAHQPFGSSPRWQTSRHGIPAFEHRSRRIARRPRSLQIARILPPNRSFADGRLLRRTDMV